MSPYYNTAVFTPDDKRIVAAEQYCPAPTPTACASGKVKYRGWLGEFDANTGHLVGRPLAIKSIIWEGVVSSDGKQFFGALGGDGRVAAYSLPNLRLLHTSPILTNGGIYGIAASPDGRSIAIVDYNGFVRLLDAKTLRPSRKPLLLTAGPAYSVSFNHDGDLLAVSGSDGTTHLVDVPDWRPIGTPFTNTAGTDAASMFGANRLFELSGKGQGSVWPLALNSLTKHACDVADRNLTLAEWQEFLPGRAYQPVCS